MADEEQFSLCWNNFNSNLSAGFHESLCRGDLVDVTLAAEGHLVKAHRLVLSVCSPYFRKMFTQMPANQHAFVFLKDVSHAALKDLIQFMYCGEVNVKQDALPTFISTAEALQIKGLTETGDASSTSAPAQSPVKIPTPAPSTTSTTAASPRTRSSGIQRNISRTSYKMDSEDSCDDKSITPAQTIVSATVATTGVAQKRIVQRSLTPVSASQSVKRLKSSDPLEESEQHHHHHHVISASDTKSTAGDEPEFIDLPIETMPTKSEPDYDESGDVEAVEHDVSYVEDDSYGDMKYDESYFTENDDAKAGASGFSEGTYAESGSGDQPSNEAQAIKINLASIKRTAPQPPPPPSTSASATATVSTPTPLPPTKTTTTTESNDQSISVPFNFGDLCNILRLIVKKLDANSTQYNDIMTKMLQEREECQLYESGERFNYNFPIKNMDELRELELNISSDYNYRRKMIRYMKKTHNNDAYAMLKKSITSNVLGNYSLYGKGDRKLSLCDLEFVKLIKDAYEGQGNFVKILQSVLKSSRNHQRYYSVKQQQQQPPNRDDKQQQQRQQEEDEEEEEQEDQQHQQERTGEQEQSDDDNDDCNVAVDELITGDIDDDDIDDAIIAMAQAKDDEIENLFKN